MSRIKFSLTISGEVQVDDREEAFNEEALYRNLQQISAYTLREGMITGDADAYVEEFKTTIGVEPF